MKEDVGYEVSPHRLEAMRKTSRIASRNGRYLVTYIGWFPADITYRDFKAKRYLEGKK